MTDFKRIVPVLKVSDMQKSVDFYTGVLGFSVAWRAANDGSGENCMLQAGATALLLSTGSHLGDRPQFTGTLYFHMSGVQEFFERVKDRAPRLAPVPQAVQQHQGRSGSALLVCQFHRNFLPRLAR